VATGQTAVRAPLARAASAIVIVVPAQAATVARVPVVTVARVPVARVVTRTDPAQVPLTADRVPAARVPAARAPAR
jgi:hypothetical protein